MRHCILSIGFVLSVLLFPQTSQAQGTYNRALPFEGFRWVPEVKLAGKWYQVRSIDGVPIEEIMEFLQRTDDDQFPRRFQEDLVEAMAKMGKGPGETMKLIVLDRESGKERTFDRLPLTKANRDAIRKMRDEYRRRPPPVVMLSAKALHKALDDFKTALDERWSYRHANDADFPGAIGRLRKRIDSGIDTSEFGMELQKIIALGIDGHAGISGYRRVGERFLPFRVDGEGTQVVAFNRERTAFLADGFPFLTRMDGKPVDDWLRAASLVVPKGSPQFVQARCLNLLRDLDTLRARLKLPVREVIDIELASADGKTRKSVTLPLVKTPVFPDTWPKGGSRVLEGNIGYLRLADMGKPGSVQEIRSWMPRFKETAGLIVDVRDNGGGYRDALLLLYSYLAAPDDPPRVFTAAAYRLNKVHADNHLVQRFMYQADAKEWKESERKAVAAFAKTFKPMWTLPRDQFSDWHYMALSRVDDREVYHYTKPVIVLLNSGCFSATDIFLAGLKGMKNVTLLGTPSSGGSAFVHEIPLGPTPFRARLGTMVSFQADGKLFDGHGVQPDLVIEPEPEYYIGGRDNVLEAAVKRAAK